MHYQQAPFSEAKLIRCLKGKIFDVMIDLRTESPSFRQWFGIELTPENHRMVYVPEMFAHGYLSLCDDTEVFYQVSAFYTPEAERGLRWDDPAIGIQWPITTGLVISEKDLNWPYLNR
jgi:dTDP-4-dehydrorhamnose 3,5-epimerase